MNPTLLIAICLIAILIIGVVKVYLGYRELKQRRDFVVEYANKFSEFAKKPGFDEELYFWLTHNSVAIQGELGQYGKIDYKPPAANYVIQNYQVIVNLLPELRREKTGGYAFTSARIYQEEVSICLDTLVRYLGVIDKRLGEALSEARNPFIWLREGVQTILLIPAFVLRWLGLISSSTISRLSKNIIFRLLSGLVAFVTLVSGLVTIAVGWEEFQNFLSSLWQSFFNR